MTDPSGISPWTTGSASNQKVFANPGERRGVWSKVCFITISFDLGAGQAFITGEEEERGWGGVWVCCDPVDMVSLGTEDGENAELAPVFRRPIEALSE